MVNHRVDGVLQLCDFALHIHRDLFGQIAIRHRSSDQRNIAHLRGKIARHEIDRISQIFPRSGNAFHFGLTTQNASGTHFARDTRNFRGKRAQSINQRVDRVLHFENLAFHINGDLPRKIATRDCRRHFSDIADLPRKIARHHVHVVGQILPRACDAAHVCLSAQFSFAAYLTCHPRDFGSKGTKLIDHRVDRVFELQNFTAHIDGDLFRQVAIRNGGRDFGNVTHLTGQITGHRIHANGQVFPGSRYSFYVCLATEFSFGAHLAGHARYFRGKRTKLVDHRIDRVFQLEDFPFHIHRDLFR